MVTVAPASSMEYRMRSSGDPRRAGKPRASVPVVATRYEGMIHPFFSMAGVLDQGKRVLAQSAAALGAAFASRTPDA